MTQPKDNQPACYGSVTVFSFDSDICKNCDFYQACGEAAKDRLNHIKSVINVDDLLARHSKAQVNAKTRREARREETALKTPVTAAQPEKPVNAPVERHTPVIKVVFEIDSDSQNVIAKIPNQKAAAQAVVLCKANMIEIAKAELSEGRNPFVDGPKYLTVAADVLLEGGFTRITLKEQYMERLSWTASTSASHVSIVVGLLPAFNIITQEGDLFVINKEA